MTNKGGIVVSPRPSTTRGGAGATSAQMGASIKNTSPMTVLEETRRRGDHLSLSGRDCVAVKTTPER
jgi:hypothetical protein